MSYDRNTLLVCNTPEFAFLAATNQVNPHLTLELVKLIAEKTSLTVEQVIDILCNELDFSLGE